MTLLSCIGTYQGHENAVKDLFYVGGTMEVDF